MFGVIMYLFLYFKIHLKKLENYGGKNFDFKQPLKQTSFNVTVNNLLRMYG